MRLNVKKLRFVALSLILIGCAYLLSTRLIMLTEDRMMHTLARYVVFMAIATILSALFVQYLEGGDRGVREVLFVGLTPFLLVISAFFFFVYYPNLSVIIKLGAGLFYTTLLYTLLLLNNVLLVVNSREDVIPVYRVAVNWVQIVLLSTSISLFTGLHRLQIQPVFQTALVTSAAFFYYRYLIWVNSYEKEVRQVKQYESIILAACFALFVGWASFIVLFISSESFLRGLFIASIFLLGLGYIQLYLKNALSKKSVWDYLFICLAILGTLVIFKR